MALASWRLGSFGVLVIGVLAVSGIALLIGGGSFSSETRMGIAVAAVAALTLIYLGRNTGAIKSAPEPTVQPSPSSAVSADPVLVQRLRQGRSGGIDITGVVLDGQDLRKASVPGLRARAASLSEVRFEDASLPGSDLAGADLNGAHLQGANLRGVNLAGADLRNADFTGACLNGADLSGALVDRAKFKGAAVDGVTADQKAIRNAENWATMDTAGSLACLL